MESNRRRKTGFLKGKLVMSIYKATKPSSAGPYNNINNNTKMKPNGPSPLPPVQQKVPHHHYNPHVEFIVNQDQVVPQVPKQKVSFVLPAAAGGASAGRGIIHDNFYGGVAADELVDTKATTYIKTVRERLIKLQRINSEHNKKL